MENKGKTPKKSIFEMVNSQKGSTKKCLLCLPEKLEIVNCLHPVELLNKGYELVSKCRQANKYLLNNYKAMINYFNIPVEFCNFINCN